MAKQSRKQFIFKQVNNSNITLAKWQGHNHMKIAAISTYTQNCIAGCGKVNCMGSNFVEDIDLPIVFCFNHFYTLKDSEVL